ncbi:MAG: hypothetical protein H7Z14_09230 [Anaerolineae bacterium]|nr:hypothetical protein [Phycisphaerae bacterium]
MMTTKQNRGKQIAAFAAILGAGTLFGTYALGAAGPVRFDPFAPTRTNTTTSLTTISAGGDTPLLPPTPVPPGRPPIRDPFRPPTRSPFTP